jgi:hypothetical protein
LDEDWIKLVEREIEREKIEIEGESYKSGNKK